MCRMAHCNACLRVIIPISMEVPKPSMSPALLYLGLMAIASVLLIKDSLRYVLDKDDKTETEASNTSQGS
mgnify:CR=1 FL=1